MHRDLAELLRRYGDDKLDPKSLKWWEFQDAVFIRMFRKCKLTGELQNNLKGEVDFVLVKPRYHPLTHAVIGDELHLFECKNYNRTIELADAAKLLLVGLRRPNVGSLNLVSRTALQPQALEYARFFFQLDHEHIAERKLGGSTVFRHFVTTDLIEFDPADLDVHLPDGTPGPLANRGFTWHLTELRPYSERTLRSAATETSTENLSTKYYYRFEASLSLPRPVKNGALRLVEQSGALQLVDEQSTSDTDGRLFRLSVIFRIGQLPASSTISLQLGLVRKGKLASLYPVTAIDVSDEAAASSEFRQNDVARFTRLLHDAREWRLVLLTGEAGAGKTRLCDRFAQEQRALAGWDIIRFDISENEDVDLIREMAVMFMLPSRLRADADLRNLRELAMQVVDILAGYDAARQAGQSRETTEPVQFVAQLAIGLGPKLIIIRNCERLRESTARNIRRLIQAIERRGWGDIRIVLEGRSEERSADWDALCHELRESVDGVILFHLSSMSRLDVYELLDGLFERIPPELKAHCWRRAGGNPLFLQNFLTWLQSRGGVESCGGRLRVVSPNIFAEGFGGATARAGDLELTGGRSDAILIARLSALKLSPFDAAASPLADPRFVLGLFALAETPARIEALIAMVGLRDVVQPLMDALRANDILEEASSDDRFRFRHDLLREAAVVQAQGAGSSEAIDALDAVLPRGFTVDEPVSLELLGDLRRFLGQRDAAWTHYQRAIATALRGEAFLDVCRIAAKQERLYGAQVVGGTRSVTDHLQTLVARAWAEWNCGSIRTAQETYHRVIDLAQKSSDAGVDSTTVQSIVAHARSRLVGIALACTDPDEFVQATTLALQEYTEVADYNSVMNRIVLFCGRFGLPGVGLQFIRFATDFVAHRPDDVHREPEGEAVICSDVARLYLPTMPDTALPILSEELRRSQESRQRLHAQIDLFATGCLASRTLDLAQWDSLRYDATRLALYGFLARLDMLRASVDLRNGHFDEAQRSLRKAEERRAIQHRLEDDIELTNNWLLHALATHARDDVLRWSTILVRSVGAALAGRERSIQPLQNTIRTLAAARSKTLADRYGRSPLSLAIPRRAPAFCGNVIVAFLNLRQLAGLDAELASVVSPVTSRVLSHFDLTLANATFLQAALRDGIAIGGNPFLLCVE